MKLIIDIPDNEYKQNKHYYDSVYHGTPLDDVKAEIRAEQEKYSHPLEIERAIEILDNIGKADMRGE